MDESIFKDFEDIPMFEIMSKDKTKHYKIYYDSRIEGFSADEYAIRNNVLSMINKIYARALLSPTTNEISALNGESQG